MSVELSGPKGYEYQYMVSIYCAILFLSDRSATMAIENESPEDSMLIIKDGEQRIKTIHFQVKNFKGAIDDEKLLEWLLHKTGRGDERMIQRLMSNPNEKIVVVSSGRCADATKRFILETGKIEEHRNRTFFRHTMRKWKRRLAEKEITKSGGKPIGQPDLSKIGKRVIIWEQEPYEEIQEKIKTLLTQKFRVPISQATTLINDLYHNCILPSRNNATDPLPEIKRVIYAVPKLGRIDLKDYVLRGIEENICTQLLAQQYIFLTGVSQCGKTMTANYILNKLIEWREIEFRIGSDIQDAERELLSSSSCELVYKLDDPFGSYIGQRDIVIKRKLDSLVKNLPAGKYLLITSRIEILQYFYGEEIKVPKKNPSFDHIISLNIPNREFLVGIWNNLTISKQVSDSISRVVLEGLENANFKDLPQPGHLFHLSAFSSSEHEGKSFEALARFAKSDAKDISCQFLGWDRKREFKEVFLALGIGTGIDGSISQTDLAFLLSNSIERPGIIQELSPNDINSVDSNFPKYNETYLIDDKHQDEIDFLELKGIVKWDDDRLIFRHSIYKEAGSFTVFLLPRSLFNWVIRMIKRGVSSPSQKMARAIAISSRQLINSFENEGKRMQLISSIRSGLRSFFPSVRDEIEVAFASTFELLEEDEQQLIQFQLVNSFSDISRIKWKGAEPWFSNRTFTTLGGNWRRTKLEEDTVMQALADLENENPLDTKRAWELSAYLPFSKDIEKMSPEILYKIWNELSKHEVFIRGNFSRTLAQKLSEETLPILKLVQKDLHPSIVSKSIADALRFSHYYSYDFFEKVMNLCEACLNNQAVSISTLPLLTFFHHHFPEKELNRLWNNWTKLSTIVVRNIPDTAYINVQYFSYAFDQAKTVANTFSLIDLSLAVCDFMVKRAEKDRRVDALFLFYEYLIQVTSPGNPGRDKTVTTFFQIPYTDFSLHLLNVNLKNSHFLSPKEISLTFHQCKKNREDSEWVNALTLLLQNHTDRKIFQDFEYNDLTSNNPSQWSEYVPISILRKALQFLCGFEGLSIYYSPSPPSPEWSAFYRYNTENPESPLFEDSIQFFYSRGIYDWANEILGIEPHKIWSELEPKLTEISIDIVFQYLLLTTIEMTGENQKKQFFWDAFFQTSQRLGKSHYYFQKIAEASMAIEAPEIEDWVEIFGKEYFFRQILPLLEADHQILTLVWVQFKKGTSTSVSKFENMVKGKLLHLLETLPNILLSTHNNVAMWCNKNHIIPDILMQKLREKRQETVENHFASKKEWRTRIDISDWVSPS